MEKLNAFELFQKLKDQSKTFGPSQNETRYILEEVLKSPKNEYDPFGSRVNFVEDQFSVAQSGGIIAVCHSSEPSILTFNPQISLFDQGLNLLRVIRSKSSKSLKGFYITPEEILVCVHDDNIVYLYSQRGDLIAKKALTEDPNFMMVYLAFWEEGLFAVAFSGQIIVLEDFSEMKVSPFANCNEFSISFVTATSNLPSNGNNYGPILWAAASKDGQYYILCIQKDSVIAQEVSLEVSFISFSPNNKLVMVKCHEIVIIYSSDFSNSYAELDLSALEIRNLSWCGDNSILATSIIKTTENAIQPHFRLIMLGLCSKAQYWDFNSGIFIVPETDGARVITSTNVYLLREVPSEDGTLSFILNSESSGLKLFSAINDKITLATKNIYTDTASIHDALIQCLSAAQFYNNITIRRALLESVVRSKHHDPSFDSSMFTQIITQIRVCDNLSSKPYNMPITILQLKGLRSDRLIIRLCNRYLHQYAFRIAEYVNERSDMIYVHWAHCLIRSNSSAKTIVKRIKENGGAVDFVELAQLSFSLGKEELGNLLLSENPIKSRCVPLYIQRKDWASAVSAAVDSNNESLLISVLKDLVSSKQDGLIADCISKNSVALAAWIIINPNDPNIVQLLANSGRFKEAFCAAFNLHIGNKLDSNELLKLTKQYKETLAEMVAKNYLVFQNVNGESNDTPVSPYKLIDNIIQSGDLSKAKTVSKTLGISKQDLLWRMVHVYISQQKPELIQNILSMGSEDMIVSIYQHLRDYGGEELFVSSLELITDSYIKQRILE